jgi:hypothetical protein
MTAIDTINTAVNFPPNTPLLPSPAALTVTGVEVILLKEEEDMEGGMTGDTVDEVGGDGEGEEEGDAVEEGREAPPEEEGEDGATAPEEGTTAPAEEEEGGEEGLVEVA